MNPFKQHVRVCEWGRLDECHMLNVAEVKPDSHLAQTYQHHPFGHSLWVLKDSKTEEGRGELLDAWRHNYHLD